MKPALFLSERRDVMKMTKKLVGVILAAVMVLTCLTACGGKKDME